MGEVITVPLAAQPNAGKPRDIEGRNLYLCSPDYMASYARRFVSPRRAPGRRLLRHDAGTHPADSAGGEGDGARRGAARCAGGRGPDAAREPAARAAAGAARGEVRPGPQARRRSVRHHRRGAAVARARCDRSASRRPARCAITRRRRRRGPRRPAQRRAAERPVAGGADVPAARHRDAAPVLVPRSQPAGDPVGPARRARDRAAQPPRHHRRCAQPGRHPRRHGGLRRRLDRSHQRRQPAEPRARHRRPVDRRADAVSHRRDGQPLARPRPGAASGWNTRSRRARSSSSPGRSSMRQAFERFLAARRRLQDSRSSSASGRSTAP